MAFLIGFSISASIFFVLNKLFPYHDMGELEEEDVYGTFTAAEAAKKGIVCHDSHDVLSGVELDGEVKGFSHEGVVEKE